MPDFPWSLTPLKLRRLNLSHRPNKGQQSISIECCCQVYSGDLFNRLWPKIIQLALDNFLDYWNNQICTQRNKLLLSGFSPNYICDFPEKFGLTHFGVAAPQPFIDALRQNIPKTRKECYRWVPDEFDAKASEVYVQIGEQKFVLTNGWTIFGQMLPNFN
ncbi:hypothetical protein B0H14DRAFT_3150621 [Mycena olivaceomarginata]|nr:hypothetical protein B0H14DRAFT_3150621 [Mycena olivaceomarginata]